MTETTMAAALKRAGIKPEEVALSKAIARWQNNGGTLERLIELARGDYGLPGEGHTSHAERGPVLSADARQQDGDVAGQARHAETGRNVTARPSPDQRSAEGRDTLADKAVPGVPSAAAPEREGKDHTTIADKAKPQSPSARDPSRSDVKAAAMVAKASAKTVLDLGWIGRDYVPGGPRYTDLRWRDIAGMVERQLKEGATHAKAALALKMIEREGVSLGQVDPERRWVDDLPADKVRAIAKATEDEALKPSLVAWLRGGNDLTQNMITEVHHAS